MSVITRKKWGRSLPNIDYKPWELYPEIWKTEAAWWSYLRGALRRGLWERSPIKLSYKNSACLPPPEGYTGRARSGAECALSGEWTAKSSLEVDHKTGNIPLLSWEDVLPFILHLVPSKGNLQLVSKEAHKVKSYAERMGISYEEAVDTKKAIKILKDKTDKEWLKAKGCEPASNAKLRRKQILEVLKVERMEKGSN